MHGFGGGWVGGGRDEEGLKTVLWIGVYVMGLVCRSVLVRVL